MFNLIPRVYVRVVSIAVIASLIFNFSPLPVYASTPATPPRVDSSLVEERSKALEPVIEQVKQDLDLLESEGKEKYVNSLFPRLDKEEEEAKVMISQAIDRIGARTLWMILVGWSSPALTAALAVVPEPWQAAALNYALSRFVRRSIRSMKEQILRTSQDILEKGLRRVVAMLTNKDFLAGNPNFAEDDDEYWWETFFGNSTIVKNFVITIIALASVGTAIGLAIAGSTAAPIVGVLGALVSIIALISGEDEESIRSLKDLDLSAIESSDDDDSCDDGACPLPTPQG